MRILWLWIALAACGGSSVDKADGGDGSGGSGACASGCPTGELCSNDVCTALPATCPCPSGSYCNLANNSCVVGCGVDDDCGAAQFCNASHECRDGCRSAAGCAPHDCGTVACTAGTCVYTNMANGTSCATDSNPCTTDTCMAGACMHKTVADYTPCYPGDSDDIKKACLAGACKASKETCTGINNGTDIFAIVYDEPSGTEGPEVTSCSCSGTTMSLDGTTTTYSCSSCGRYDYDTDYYFTYCLQ
jgi:hypothetical protein